MTALEALAIAAIVVVAAAMQGSIGFGQNLLAAPLVSLIDDRFVPGPLLVGLLVTGLIMARREWRAADHVGAAWAIAGIIPMTAAGVTLLGLMNADTTAVVFSMLVLMAVALSACGIQVSPNPPAVFGAGAAAGLMQSITAIPGAPLALVYQQEAGPRIRSTLAIIFVFSSLIAITALSISGDFGRSELLLSCIVAPAAAGGVVVSHPLARHVDRRDLRPILLGVVGLAAIGSLVELAVS